MTKEKVKPRPGLSALLSDEASIQLSSEEKLYIHAFWRPVLKEEYQVNPEGETLKVKKVSEATIDYIDFYDFLYYEGFRRFVHGEDIFFIRITNGKILKRIRLHHIQDAVTLYLKQLPEIVNYNGYEISSRQIITSWIKKQDALLNEKRLQALLRPNEEMHFNKDLYREKFMYFKNGFLVITADTIKFKDYKYLKGYIWESEILNRDFKFPNQNPELNYAYKFMMNIAGGNPVRFRQLQNITGYLMHSFMQYKRKAILFTDGVIDPEGNANGRSCKSLFCEMIGWAISTDPRDPNLKSFISINGKDFDPADKHKYSQGDIDTKIIAINDLKRVFDVEILFNDITEGVTVDKKSLQPFRIEPKLILTTNKTLKIEGGSASDRFVEFEFSDHYNENFSPEQEFGHWFFRDWKDEDFSRFYFHMASCVQIFFKDGRLAKPKSINLDRRKLIDSTHKDFLDFMENDWKPTADKLYEKQAIFNQFIEAFPDFKNPQMRFTQNKFTIWVKNFMNYSPTWENYKINHTDLRVNEKGVTTRYYKFIKSEDNE